MEKLKIIQDYITSIHKGNGADFISEDIQYMVESLDELFTGKDFYLERTKAFYSNTTSCEIKTTVTEGNKIFLIVRYELKSPSGKTSQIDIAEFFEVNEQNLISSHAIFFDSAFFGKFMSGN